MKEKREVKDRQGTVRAWAGQENDPGNLVSQSG